MSTFGACVATFGTTTGWDLMEVCDKADNLTNEEEEAVSDIFMACTRLSDFIIAQNRKQECF